MENNNFHNYEIMYIIDDKNEAKAEALKQEFTAILTKDGGTITKEEDSIRQFAQLIDRKSSGHYFSIWTKTTPQNIAEFNRIYLIKQHQGDVMHNLVINHDSEPVNTFKEIKERPAQPAREFNPRRMHNNHENQGRNDDRSKYQTANRFRKDNTEQPKVEKSEKQLEPKT